MSRHTKGGIHIYKKKIDALLNKAKANNGDVTIICNGLSAFSKFFEVETKYNIHTQIYFAEKNQDMQLLEALEDRISLAKEVSESYVIMINRLCDFYEVESVFDLDKDIKTLIKEFIDDYFGQAL